MTDDDDKAGGWAHPSPDTAVPATFDPPGPVPALCQVAYRETDDAPWRYGQVEFSSVPVTRVRWNDDVSTVVELGPEEAARLVRKPPGAPSRLDLGRLR